MMVRICAIAASRSDTRVASLVAALLSEVPAATDCMLSPAALGRWMTWSLRSRDPVAVFEQDQLFHAAASLGKLDCYGRLAGEGPGHVQVDLANGCRLR